MNPSPRRFVSLSLVAAAFAFTPAARADDSVASQRSADLQQTIRTLQDTTDASGLAQLGEATCALADTEIAASRRVAVPTKARGGILTAEDAER
jgi:hypothetical protein